MTEKSGFEPTTGAWNDSLTGDFLWSRNNFGEARPDVMSPFTYSITEKVWSKVSFLPGYRLSGNICGRFYANVSVSLSMLVALGKSKETAIEQIKDLLGNVPSQLDIPRVPMPRSTMLMALPRMIKLGLKEKNGAKRVPEFLKTNPKRCREMRRKIQNIQDKTELIDYWSNNLEPELIDGIWLLGGATQPLEATVKLRKELAEMVGVADANALSSNLSIEDDLLASMGPVVGMARVVQGKMSQAEYLQKYGYRGPHEAEISMPRPAEDPEWFARQLADYEQSPVNVDALLAERQHEFKAAWERLQERCPNKAQKLRRKIDQIGPAARMREAVRDELTRFLWVEREWALRAGALTDLGNDIFLLTIDEVLDVLSGVEAATVNIPARKETYDQYRALPTYPMIIRGNFDAFRWAADPNRRYDIYDASVVAPLSASSTITGFAGAAGRVEGRVRLLDAPEQGEQLRPGEILVAVTTNVGWTPLARYSPVVKKRARMSFRLVARTIFPIGKPIRAAR